MTTVYFVRHAQPDCSNHNDMERELTEKGLKDSKLVTKYLFDKDIYAVLSSPYKRSVDTVKHFADSVGLEIETVEDFRERRVDSEWIEDFDSFCRQQWSDFSYKLTDGEALGEVQRRNIDALFKALDKYKNQSIVIGSHGTALSTIINFFDDSFKYDEFEKIRETFPWIVKLTFDGKINKEIEYIDAFSI